jgi:hypothetical protein
VRNRRRALLNWLNGSTLLGLVLARAGGARLRRRSDGLWLAEGHALPGVRAPFTLGDVLLHSRPGGFATRPRLLRHEARHAEQYARWGGLLFLPVYGVSALVSWVLTGDRASGNPFERQAGLGDGGYRTSPGRRRGG